jgi:hypothetical protein
VFDDSGRWLVLLFCAACSSTPAGGGGTDASSGGGSGGGSGGQESGGTGGSGGQTDAGLGSAGGSGGSACDNTVQGAACSPFNQCGCTTNEKCDLGSTGQLGCFPAGAVPDPNPFEPCDGPSDCAPTLLCIDGACRPTCKSEADCTMGDRAQSHCNELQPGLGVCNAQCLPAGNPPSLNGCGDGLNCEFKDVENTDCIPAGQGTGTGDCVVNEDCAVGYGCFSPGDCKRWCLVANDAPCSLGYTCGELSNHPTMGGKELGYCVPE